MKDKQKLQGRPLRPIALMFAVKDWDAAERRSGEIAVGRNGPELRRAGSGARDDGRSDSYPRVTAFRVYVSGLSSV
jgi:hypothetical protein